MFRYFVWVLILCTNEAINVKVRSWKTFIWNKNKMRVVSEYWKYWIVVPCINVSNCKEISTCWLGWKIKRFSWCVIACNVSSCNVDHVTGRRYRPVLSDGPQRRFTTPVNWLRTGWARTRSAYCNCEYRETSHST